MRMKYFNWLMGKKKLIVLAGVVVMILIAVFFESNKL